MRTFHILVSFLSGALALENSGAPRQDDADCQVFLDDSAQWPDWPPVLTDADGQFILPSGTFFEDNRVIQLNEGEQWEMSCVGKGFEISQSSDFLTAQCTASGKFDVDGEEYDFIQLGCVEQPIDSTNDIGEPCGPDDVGRIIQLGFRVDAGDSYSETVNACFDEDKSRALYSYETLYKENVGRDTSNDSPEFNPDVYYPFDVELAYTRDETIETLGNLLGSVELAESYILPYETNIYFQRGHLSPNADQIYYSLQDSTYYYINVAPEWGIFNGNHWLDIENSIRTYVENQGKDLTIYTGTSGVMELKDINDVNTEIYLYPDYDDPSANRLPVPKFFWKVAVDEVDDTAVGLVGVNNPWLTDEEIDQTYRICPDSAPDLVDHPMLLEVGNPDFILFGVVYACTYQDIKAAFEEVPDLGNPGLLL